MIQTTYRVFVLTAMSAVLWLNTTIPTQAIQRIETLNTTCASINEVIRRDGEAILRFPSKRIKNYTLFDRYVANDRFCRPGQEAAVSFVEAKDTNRCVVRKCKDVDPIFRPLFKD